MSSYEPISTSPLGETIDHGTDAEEQLALSAQQLQRVAELVAIGDLPLPQHLPGEQLSLLVRTVRERRRRRLVQFVARAIAMHVIHGDRQGGQLLYVETRFRPEAGLSGHRLPASQF